jgi:hypothetical protein
VSDVIVLREAIPETGDVVAPLDAGHKPRFTMRDGGGCRCRGRQLQKRVTRPPAPRRVIPFFLQEGTPTPGAPEPDKDK